MTRMGIAAARQTEFDFQNGDADPNSGFQLRGGIYSARSEYKSGRSRPLRPFMFYLNRLAVGGAERDRTADLLIANEALSQLSYGPPKNATASPVDARKWARAAI